MKMTRRETLQGIGVLAAAEALEKTTDGGYAAVSLPGVPKRMMPILPPGAVDVGSFRLACVGCGLCSAACPEHVLKPSMKLSSFGQPVMDFRESHCRLACDYRCGAACPTGAIRRLADVPRKDVHMGRAIWHKDLCIRTAKGEACTACVRKCPVKAIRLVEGFPVVDDAVCIGCGACEHVCPSRPLPAIEVEGYERSRIVRKMDEADLVAEMLSLVRGGSAAVVTARGGVIAARESGRGLQPILKLHADGALADAIVADKVIGRAAAAICVAGGAREVRALVMSADAKKLLDEHGIPSGAEALVPKILNRDRSGSCPMELKVEAVDDPVRMVEILRQR